MPFRFYILFLGWLSLTSISSNVNVFNVARLCMNNGDETDPNAIFYTEHEYNSLIIASSIGTLLATLPFNWIYTQVGARLVFFCAGLISILSTVLIPICVEFGYKWLYAARFVQGIAYASDFASVSGPIFHIPLKFIFGLCSDKIKIFEEVNKMRLFNTIAVFLPGFCFLAISYIPVEFPWLHVTMFSLIGITFAAAGGGFYKCAALYSREHSSFVIANIQVVKALTMLLGPTLMNWLVEDVTQQSQWRLIFVPMALSVFISNCLFCWLVSDRPAKFTFSALEEAGKPSISNPQTSALNVQRHN
ncbi:MFS domain-containing protein [Aphelenchoides bicaudatus]|nr:MFS domain-containing protein [Aphelenchoides bicaudatus]